MLSTLKCILVQVWRTVFTLSTLFSISVFLYILFYYWHVPELVSKHRVYFQHDIACHQLSSKPLDSCLFVYYDLPNVNREGFFKFGQRYHVDLELQMPDSPVNRNLGMFMINLKLMDNNNHLLFASSRPARLFYRSTMVRLAQQMIYIVPLVLGLSSEVDHLHIGLIDDDHQQTIIPFHHVDKMRLEVVTYREIEMISPSQLVITAQMEGIQYWMYFWKYTFASVAINSIFISLAFFVSVLKVCAYFYDSDHLNHSYLTGGLDPTEEVTPAIFDDTEPSSTSSCDPNIFSS